MCDNTAFIRCPVCLGAAADSLDAIAQHLAEIADIIRPDDAAMASVRQRIEELRVRHQREKPAS
jgi:hypothetical protein